MSINLLFINPRGVLSLLSPASLIYHRWISCSLLMPPLLIVMHKIRCKAAFSRAFSHSIEVLLPCNCPQFGSNKLTIILTGVDASHIDTKYTFKIYKFDCRRRGAHTEREGGRMQQRGKANVISTTWVSLPSSPHRAYPSEQA